MANFSLQIKGLDELLKSAQEAKSGMPNRLYQAMVKATGIVQSDAKAVKAGSFKNQTGNLRRSIMRKVDGPLHGMIFTDQQYAQYVEEGTRARVILPRNGKALRWKDASGQYVFAKQVNFPGSKAYPFMEPALRGNTQKIFDIYDDVAGEIVKILAS